MRRRRQVITLILILSVGVAFFVCKGKELIAPKQVDKPPVFLMSSYTAYHLYQEPTKVKGIYIPPQRLNELDSFIDLAKKTGINSFVIDVKLDYGYLSFKSDLPSLKESGCILKNPLIKDIKEVMNKLYQANIYPIARVVVFKDNVVGKEDSSRVLHYKDQTPYVTSDGQMWLDPSNHQNREYILQICQEAVRVGFKEVQLDYVRFHESMHKKILDLPESFSKTQTILDFVQYITDNLSQQGVKVSADVFGAIINSPIDSEIVGQDYCELVKRLDYISPMVYPSHYGEGAFGIEYPDCNPYGIILKAMQSSEDIIREIPRANRRAKVRPWLQAFTATWKEHHQDYGIEEINAQIQAVYDAGLEQWILWNGSGNYNLEGIKL